MQRWSNCVFEFSMDEIFVERGCMKVMREHVNDHFKQDIRRREGLQYAAGHAGGGLEANIVDCRMPEVEDRYS